MPAWSCRNTNSWYVSWLLAEHIDMGYWNASRVLSERWKAVKRERLTELVPSGPVWFGFLAHFQKTMTVTGSQLLSIFKNHDRTALDWSIAVWDQSETSPDQFK